MTVIRLLVLALMFSTITACATTKDVVVDCSKEASSDIVGNVDAIIGNDTYVAELAKLVEKFGNCVIKSAVTQIAAKYKGSADVKMATDSLASKKLAHAEAWLAART